MKLKKPYMEEYSRVYNFIVWIVDGEYVREHFDKEFTNFGQHYNFKFIPKDEFWIDKEYGDDNECPYFIDNMLAERKFLARGMNPIEAGIRANKVEMCERKKSEEIFKELNSQLSHEKLLRKIHLKLLIKYSGAVDIWIVNGRLVRDLYFLDFTEGGHDRVYRFIPKNEVWIDDDLSPNERKFVILHELHERNLMCQGWCYEPNDPRAMIKEVDRHAKIHKSAHFAANELEFHYRRNPQDIDKVLKEEVALSNSLARSDKTFK